MRGILLVAGLALWGLALPSTAEAQGPPGGGGGPPAGLSVEPADVVFASPSELEFDLGWVDHGGVSITVEPRANRPNWQLFVQASAADMGGYGKPVQDLQVRVQGSSSWMSLNTTAQMIAEGSGTSTVTVYYRLMLSWSVDAPGAYSVPLEYTASSF